MDRNSNLELIKSNAKWDLIVIGGGANGLGTALEAVSRGYKTLLLEQGDFAQGTSSRSTKLIHGGIRYLPQGRFLFVRSALRERATLMQNAPHLVHALPLILPSHNWFEYCYYGIGLKLYDILAGQKNIHASSLLSKDQVLKHIPTLNPEFIKGGICYFDGQFDDARLAICLAQTVEDQGGTVLNYMKVQELIKSDDRVIGVAAKDLEGNHDYNLFANIVINATGGYADALRKMDDEDIEPSLVLSQGTHIVLNRSFYPSDHSLIIPKSSDGRILFVIPWYNRVLVGTTDVEIGAMTSDPRPKVGEIEYLLQHTKDIFSNNPAPSDILSVFSGIRALLKPKRRNGTSQITREHSIEISQSNLVSILGGKWTTFRLTGEETVNIAAQKADLPIQPSKTQKLRLHGWTKHLQPSEWQYYGSDLPLVEKLGVDNPSLLEKFNPELPCRGVDVIWSVRHEMARCLEDVLSRRNRSLLLGAIESMEIAPQVAELMAKELGKDKIWESEQVDAYRQLAIGYLPGKL